MLRKTSLYDIHLKLSGQMIDFGGWSLPVRYSSIVKENLAVRHEVGIFDVSHMGNFLVFGKDAYEFLNHLIANDLDRIDSGEGLYSPLLYENGTFVDDLIVYMVDRECFLLIVNASNIKKDFDWIQSKLTELSFDANFSDISDKKSLVAIQGRQANELIKQLYPNHDLENPFNFSFDPNFDRSKEGFINETMELPTLIANTGYTGESGVEILIDQSKVSTLFLKALELGATPCGLGARDSLRLEKGYSLYGHEITDMTDALEAGLSWTIGWKKNFIGKESLLEIKKMGVKRRLVGLILEGKRVAREGTEIYDEFQERQIGMVTSGGVSPSLEKNIALGYIEINYKSKMVAVKIRNDFSPAHLQGRVFV